MTLLATILAEAEEPSKTPFYIAGGLLAGWAVVLSAVGLTRHEFPGSAAVARGVMAISTLLVAGAMVAAVASS